MVYRRGSREGYLDRADREEVLPEEYVAPPKVPPQAPARPQAPGQRNAVPRAAEAAVGGAIFELVGIVPQPGAPAEITCHVLGELCKFLPDELEELGRTMLIVAHTARLIRA
jgi:hypothetical protein